MTVICFDGKTLASDGQSTGDWRDLWDDNPKFAVVRPGVIVAAAGDHAWCDAIGRWAKSGRRKYPLGGEKAQDSEALVYRKGVWVKHFSHDAAPERAGSSWALGSGAVHAVTALVLGHDAIAACWAAMQLEPQCGGSIFAAELKDLVKYGNEAIERCGYEGPPRKGPGVSPGVLRAGA